LQTADLITTASIIAGFGVAVLMFRIQRELYARERDWPSWIASSDWLRISSTLIALLLVLTPLAVFGEANKLAHKVAGAPTCASVILLAGYVPSILAHYRFILYDGRDPKGRRTNPEPSELTLIVITVVLAIVGVVVFLAKACHTDYLP
jgi:uncharacterized membrane protein YidH (DUF202 family)